MQKLKIITTRTKNFDDFISWCKIKNLREHTIASYNLAWKVFNQYYKGEIYDITQNTITGFILHTHKRVKTTTVNQYLRHLRAIFKYFELNLQIKMLKVDLEPKTPYNKEELKKLLVKPNIKKVPFITYRNWVVINAMLATGARANTIVNIKIADVDLENRFITFTTLKNRKIKRLPIPEILVEILNEYISFRNANPAEYLFCNAYGEKAKVNDLYHSINNYNHSRCVEKTGLHRFRHTFAKEFMLNGGDILSLQHMLTHATLEQTRQYINLLDIDVQVMIKINPLEVLMENKTKIKIK